MRKELAFVSVKKRHRRIETMITIHMNMKTKTVNDGRKKNRGGLTFLDMFLSRLPVSLMFYS
jgi:hypothetical protein